MPIYEYLCEKCGHEFEREQRITEDPIKKCPSCGSSQAKRLISATSFVLKGGGWYSDLYSSAKGKSEGADKSESKTESKTETKTSGDSGSSESKPAATEKPATGKKAPKPKPTAAA